MGIDVIRISIFTLANMIENAFFDTNFEKIIHAETPMNKGEYENCHFINCDFSNADFSKFRFLDCEFQDCNLSLMKCHQAIFQDVIFEKCKMLGVRFDTCNEFGLHFSFEQCQLNHASFYQRKLKKISFSHCSLEEVDFSMSDLSQASFASCNLSKAVFEHTNLEKADFSSALNFSIDPEKNQVKGAKFSVWNLAGLLEKYQLKIEG